MPLKPCCEGCETPYCSQCGTKQPTSPLKSLLTYLRLNERKTKDRARHFRWGEWADAVQATIDQETKNEGDNAVT